MFWCEKSIQIEACLGHKDLSKRTNAAYGHMSYRTDTNVYHSSTRARSIKAGNHASGNGFPLDLRNRTRVTMIKWSYQLFIGGVL